MTGLVGVVGVGRRVVDVDWVVLTDGVWRLVTVEILGVP